MPTCSTFPTGFTGVTDARSRSTSTYHQGNDRPEVARELVIDGARASGAMTGATSSQTSRRTSLNGALGSTNRPPASADAATRIALARFFAENLAVHAPALERCITEGADTIATAAALE